MPKAKGELEGMLAKLSQMDPPAIAAVLERLDPAVRHHAETLLARSTSGDRPANRGEALRRQGLSAWMIDRIEGRHRVTDATRIAITDIAERLRSDVRSGKGHEDLPR